MSKGYKFWFQLFKQIIDISKKIEEKQMKFIFHKDLSDYHIMIYVPI